MKHIYLALKTWKNNNTEEAGVDEKKNRHFIDKKKN